jgi:hypothetical protein
MVKNGLYRGETGNQLPFGELIRGAREKGRPMAIRAQTEVTLTAMQERIIRRGRDEGFFNLRDTRLTEGVLKYLNRSWGQRGYELYQRTTNPKRFYYRKKTN